MKKVECIIKPHRLEEEEEYTGLDFGEHGAKAYPEFATVLISGGAPSGSPSDFENKEKTTQAAEKILFQEHVEKKEG